MTGTLRAPLVALTLAVAMLLTLAIPSAATAQTADGLTQQITAPVTDEATGDAAGEFVGDLEITSITRDGGNLVFTGDLVGDLVDPDGNVIDSIDETIEFTGTLQQVGQNACQILSLDLGPLNLDLLGLVVDLSDVQLDITAERGAGNLLGNLLCTVAGLLDGPGAGGGLLNAVDRLLDRITGLLG
jgi:hypothetical protein